MGLDKQLAKLFDHITTCKSSGSHTLFVILIENMHMLNLAYGHAASSKLISELARTLTKEISGKSKAFKIQHDQIALVTDKTEAIELLETEAILRKSIRQFGRNNSSNKTAHISSCLSYEVIDKRKSPQKLLDTAYSKALSSSLGANISENGKNNHNQEHSLLEMDLANQIEQAIAKKKLKLCYQPIIQANSGDVAYYECLLRLKDSKGKLKSAGSLIPIAEKMGFIDSIDVAVLEMVIADLKKNPELTLSFNISNLTIGNKDWIKTFFDKVTPNIAERMMVEITETAASRNFKETAYFIATMQEAGCKVALDDFGSGYTSFRQIKSLSIDTVKIDGSLIHDLSSNNHNQLMVKSLISLIKDLGLHTVGEHIDKGATAKLLMGYGIDFMQGNYFGEAVAKIS